MIFSGLAFTSKDNANESLSTLLKKVECPDSKKSGLSVNEGVCLLKLDAHYSFGKILI